MWMTDKQNSNLESKKSIELPTLADAQQDRKEYESLIVDAGDSPRIKELRIKAELWTNYILQSAGTVPDGDPRHEVFEHYNSILAHR